VNPRKPFRGCGPSARLDTGAASTPSARGGMSRGHATRVAFESGFKRRTGFPPGETLPSYAKTMMRHMQDNTSAWLLNPTTRDEMWNMVAAQCREMRATPPGKRPSKAKLFASRREEYFKACDEQRQRERLQNAGKRTVPAAAPEVHLFPCVVTPPAVEEEEDDDQGLGRGRETAPVPVPVPVPMSEPQTTPYRPYGDMDGLLEGLHPQVSCKATASINVLNHFLLKAREKALADAKENEVHAKMDSLRFRGGAVGEDPASTTTPPSAAPSREPTPVPTASGCGGGGAGAAGSTATPTAAPEDAVGGCRSAEWLAAKRALDAAEADLQGDQAFHVQGVGSILDSGSFVWPEDMWSEDVGVGDGGEDGTGVPVACE